MQWTALLGAFVPTLEWQNAMISSLGSTVSAIEQGEKTSWKHHLLLRETELLCFLFAESQWVR